MGACDKKQLDIKRSDVHNAMAYRFATSALLDLVTRRIKYVLSKVSYTEKYSVISRI